MYLKSYIGLQLSHATRKPFPTGYLKTQIDLLSHRSWHDSPNFEYNNIAI